jgi:hypothetical protein
LLASPADRAAFPYDGFISYRHSPKQMLIVRAIQAALHKFAKPFWKLRALRLYRDESNLSARPDLWGQIAEALDRSRYLLFVASPEAVESKWVKREMEHWLERRGERNLIILLTDGQIAMGRRDTAVQCGSNVGDSQPAAGPSRDRAAAPALGGRARRPT